MKSFVYYARGRIGSTTKEKKEGLTSTTTKELSSVEKFTTTEKKDKKNSIKDASTIISTIYNNAEEELWYLRCISLLFDTNKGSMDLYWKDVILNFQKLSSRSMIQQLNSNDGCSIGYDPLAIPNNIMSPTI